jgi:hypothetical protein
LCVFKISRGVETAFKICKSVSIVLVADANTIALIAESVDDCKSQLFPLFSKNNDIVCYGDLSLYVRHFVVLELNVPVFYRELNCPGSFTNIAKRTHTSS